jgi:hypothetical protein
MHEDALSSSANSERGSTRSSQDSFVTAPRGDGLAPVPRDVNFGSIPESESTSLALDEYVSAFGGTQSVPTNSIAPSSNTEEIDISDSISSDARQNTVINRAAELFSKFVQGTDLFHALRLGDTAEFLQLLRHGGETGNLGTMLANLGEMEAALDDSENVDLHASVRDSLKSSIRGVRTQLDSLNTDHSVPHRVLGAAATTLAGATPLALAVPYGLNQLKYLALQVAFYAKTAAYTAGAVRNPNSGKADWIKLGIERHALTGVQALMYVAPAFSSSHHIQELRDNIIFNVSATGVAITVLASTYYRHDIGVAIEKMAGKLGKNTPFNIEELRGNFRDDIKKILELAQNDKERLGQAKTSFGGIINDIAEGKVGDAVKQYDLLIKKLTSMLNAGETESDVSNAQNVPNTDFVPKVGMAVLTALATATTSALILPDYAGVVDFAADAVFVTALMVLGSKDPLKTLKSAAADLQNFVGLSITALPILAFDKIRPSLNPLPGGIDKANLEAMAELTKTNIRSPGFIATTTVLTAANLLLPSHIGGAFANLAIKATDGFRRLCAGPEVPAADQADIEADDEEIVVRAAG